MRKFLYQLIACALIALVPGSASYAIKPSRIYQAVPDTLHLPYEKNVITTTDRVKLKSWTFLPNAGVNKKVTLVLAYSDAGNMSWWLTYSTVLSQLGYTVVLFDYRGFGESDDFAIDSKMLYYNEFVRDLEAVVQFAKVKYKGNRTGIWCFSMGTIVATLAAETAKPDFIIGDSYVTSPIKIQEYYALQKTQIDLPPDAGKYGTTLNRVNLPVLIFSGDKDQVTTYASVKKLKERITPLNIKTYHGGHMEGFNVLSGEYPGSEYASAIGKFLKVE